jgi:hypothetical protein
VAAQDFAQLVPSLLGFNSHTPIIPATLLKSQGVSRFSGYN